MVVPLIVLLIQILAHMELWLSIKNNVVCVYIYILFFSDGCSIAQLITFNQICLVLYMLLGMAA